MTFRADQVTELKAPLNAYNVKQRSQGGRSLSYVEGWHAIAEANRIFGFDAWSRETVETKCVAERERTIGKEKAQGWGVTYTAKVRIQVDASGTAIIREGCGTGHGIDRDLGQAHESAIKEAETDAMKRALMTFGNPFGLALYDRTQANVVDNSAASEAPIEPKMLSVEESKKATDELIQRFKEAKNLPDLRGTVSLPVNKTIAATVTDADHQRLNTAYGDRKAELEGA